MGALTSLWIPSFVLGHILGLVFLLYALEKINGSLTRLGKLVSRLATSRGRTKDAPSPSSTEAAAAASTPSAGGKGAALAKERAASIKQTSLYADDGLGGGADGGAANGDGIDSDSNPAVTTPRRALLPRWNRACKCEVRVFVFLFFLLNQIVLLLRIAIGLAVLSPLRAEGRQKRGGKSRARLGFCWIDWR